MKKLLTTISFITLTSTASFALIEGRITYGGNSSTVNLNDFNTSSPSAKTNLVNQGIGADLIVTPPLFPLGLGVRYENLGFKVSDSLAGIDTNVTRTAALINYRIIDTLLFVGPIASFGLSHSGKLKVSVNGVETSNFEAKNGTSSSFGIEAGGRLVGLQVGAEIGVQQTTLNFEDSTNNTKKDVVFDGNYFKVAVGFSF